MKIIDPLELSNMTILGIDSSDNFVSIGIVSNFNQRLIISSKYLPVDIKNKVLIHNFLSEILAETGLEMNSLNGIAITIGPGSFTGLRVGMAVAKGICWALNLPLAGISSLIAIAHSHRSANGRLLAVKDARRGEFYFAAYDCHNDHIDTIMEDSVGPPSKIVDLIDRGFAPVGPGLNALSKLGFFPNLNNSVTFDPNLVGGSVALLGLDRFQNNDIVDIGTSSPNYIRIPKPGKAV
jgi:tRNA threonylcarbamoyladenosine biosynthesis protein TsaB